MLGLVFGDEFQKLIFRSNRDDDGTHAVAECQNDGIGTVKREDRQEADGAVLALDVVEHRRFWEDGMQDVLRGQHHAFHGAGGAAGLEQGGHLVGLPVIDLGFVLALGLFDEVFPMAEFLVFQEHLFPSVEPFANAVPERNTRYRIGT